MNKKILLVIVVFAVLSIFFCGCGGKSASSVPVPTTPSEQTLPDPADIHTVVVPTTPTPAPESTPEPAPKVDVEWQTLTYQWEDSSGYTFEATIKISPWINTKNEEYVTAAWDEVSRGKALPYFNPNEHGYYNGKYAFLGVENLTDMYYCIGEVYIKNITTGWSITSENPISSDKIYLSPIQINEEVAKSVKEGRTISQVIYGNKTTSDYVWAEIAPQLKSNSWGPIPFIFAHYDRKTPKCPEGEYSDEMTDTAFCITTHAYARANPMLTKLSIIEKDD